MHEVNWLICRLFIISRGTTKSFLICPCVGRCVHQPILFYRCIFTTIDPESGARDKNMEPLKTLRKYALFSCYPPVLTEEVVFDLPLFIRQSVRLFRHCHVPYFKFFEIFWIDMITSFRRVGDLPPKDHFKCSTVGGIQYGWLHLRYKIA